LQLDELRATKRSPICAAVKDEQQALRPEQVFETPGTSGPIRKGKVWHSLSNLRPCSYIDILRLDHLGPFLGCELSRLTEFLE
jgi:hypothetical protein